MEAPWCGERHAQEAILERGWSLRPMASGDIGAVVAIAAGSAGTARWSAGDYAQVGGGIFDGWVVVRKAALEEVLAGFLIARRVADEMEILNLAVDRAFRRMGLASRLVEFALEFGRKYGAKRVFLEVRASNLGAIAFYHRAGFALLARRPNYCADPPEDALVLWRAIDRESV